MEKIIDVTALTDALKILLWDRSKTREELAELVIGLIKEAGEEIVRCKDCKKRFTIACDMSEVDEEGDVIAPCMADDFYCPYGRRDSDG